MKRNLLGVAVVAMLVSVAACGGSGSGGTPPTPTPTPIWQYPNPSVGADNDYGHYGASFARWYLAGARLGLVIQSPGNHVVDMEADARSAYAAGYPVYVYFCITPPGMPMETTVESLNLFVDDLNNANVLTDINTYHAPLIVVYDLEDSDVCGPWKNVDVPTAESWITYWSQVIINRAQYDGLATNRPVVFAAVPGIDSPFPQDGTTALSAWITNNFPTQFGRTNTFFPQLFGPHVNTDWAQLTASRLQTFNAAGISYANTNPNYEDFHGDGNCDTQGDIDTIWNWTLYVTSNLINIHTWYPYYDPFCVQ